MTHAKSPDKTARAARSAMPYQHAMRRAPKRLFHRHSRLAPAKTPAQRTEGEKRMASHAMYQFYTELLGFEPKIWRRFQVDSTVTAAQLGYILMALFEMQACHPFYFDVPALENFKTCVGEYIDNEVNARAMAMFQTHPERAHSRIELSKKDESAELNAQQIQLKNVLDHENERTTFVYDFKENWQVALVLEAIVESSEPGEKELPCVLEGEGYGIFEDCGGVKGLSKIVKAFRKRRGRLYRQYLRWTNRKELDFDSFNAGEMNLRLKKLPRIFADIYEQELNP